MEFTVKRNIIVFICILPVCWSTSSIGLPPTITNQNEDPIHYKQPGGAVELYCEADGYPAPDYEWKKDGQILDINTASVEPIAGGIRLKELGYEHQGEYQCFASNPFGTTMTNLNSVILSVISAYPPNEPTEVYIVDEGDPLKVICKYVKSIPMERTRQDWATVIDRDSSENTDIILDRRVQQDDLGNLIFSYVTKEDEKDGYLYQCRVTNDVAAISTFGSWSTITINEVDPPISFVQPKIQFNTGKTTGDTVVALKREQISLRCLFSGKPPPEVSWSRVGRYINHDRMKQSQFNTVLTIYDVRDSDQGQYQCTGTNHQKQISDSKIMTIIVEGETIPPRVSILQNGRTLLIKDVCKHCPGNKSDIKVYQCLAENKHGSVFVSSYLNILWPTEEESASLLYVLAAVGSGGVLLIVVVVVGVLLFRRRNARRRLSPPDDVNNPGSVTTELQPQVTSSQDNTGGEVEYEMVDTDTYYSTIRDNAVTDNQTVNDPNGNYLTPITYMDVSNEYLTTTTNIDDANSDHLTPTTNINNAYQTLSESRDDYVNVSENNVPKVYTPLQTHRK